MLGDFQGSVVHGLLLFAPPYLRPASVDTEGHNTNQHYRPMLGIFHSR